MIIAARGRTVGDDVGSMKMLLDGPVSSPTRTHDIGAALQMVPETSNINQRSSGGVHCTQIFGTVITPVRFLCPRLHLQQWSSAASLRNFGSMIERIKESLWHLFLNRDEGLEL